jgi:hypothetical protein
MPQMVNSELCAIAAPGTGFHSNAQTPRELRAKVGGRIAEEKRMRSEPSPTRSCTREQRTATRPMQIKISRSRRSPVTEQPLAAVLGQLVGMGGCDLGLDGLCQQRSRAVAPPYAVTNFRP